MKMWCVIEQLVPVGNSASVRVHGPFLSEEKAKAFRDVVTTAGPVQELIPDPRATKIKALDFYNETCVVCSTCTSCNDDCCIDCDDQWLICECECDECYAS